jgi:hypothetical protein
VIDQISSTGPVAGGRVGLMAARAAGVAVAAAGMAGGGEAPQAAVTRPASTSRSSLPVRRLGRAIG